MDRRNFLLSLAASGLLAPLSSALAATTKSPRLQRLSVSSPTFRELFRKTNPDVTDPITLEDFPALVRDRLGLSQVEMWTVHFDDRTPEYCRRLRAAAERAGSSIVNIQYDDRQLNLADPDKAARAASVASVKQWMDRAALCGAPRLRTNVNLESTGQPDELELATESFSELARYGRSIGVKILAENHMGFTSSIDNTIALVRAVNDPWCRAIADWGNSPAKDDAGRVADIARLMPYVELVSAKGQAFDDAGRHLSYDQAALVKSAESGGFEGIYSVELWGAPPADTVVAVHSVLRTIVENLKSG